MESLVGGCCISLGSEVPELIAIVCSWDISKAQ